jgi:hypothetical protein
MTTCGLLGCVGFAGAGATDSPFAGELPPADPAPEVDVELLVEEAPVLELREVTAPLVVPATIAPGRRVKGS